MTSRDSEASTARRVETETSSQTPEARKIDVHIRGQKLTVRSDRDPEFVEALADHVDQKVASLQKAAPAAPLSKLLMLASMTVAEELFEARREIDRLKQEISDRSETMLALLEEADIDADTSGSGQ